MNKEIKAISNDSDKLMSYISKVKEILCGYNEDFIQVEISFMYLIFDMYICMMHLIFMYLIFEYLHDRGIYYNFIK